MIRKRLLTWFFAGPLTNCASPSRAVDSVRCCQRRLSSAWLFGMSCAARRPCRKQIFQSNGKCTLERVSQPDQASVMHLFCKGNCILIFSLCQRSPDGNFICRLLQVVAKAGFSCPGNF